MNRKELEQKCQRFEQFLAHDPENTLLLIQLGDLYHSLGEFSQARQAFSRCIEFEPTNQVAKGRMASVLMSQGEMSLAENMLKQLLDAEPDNAALRHNYAISLYAQHKLTEAKGIFMDQAEHVTLGRSARFYLASVLQLEDRVQDALEIVNQLLLQQEEVYLLGYQSTLLYLLERVDQAIAVAQRVLRIDEYNADACSILGNFYAEKLEYDVAQQMFERILRHSPTDVRGWHGVGILKMMQDDIPGAVGHFERTTEMVPESIAMWNTLGWAYFNSQRFQDSEKTFSRVIELDESNPEGWGGLASALALQNRVEEAEQAMRKALRLDRHSFSALFAKSVLLALRGNKEQGDKLFTKVLEQPVRPGGERTIDAINRYIKLNQVRDTAMITSHSSKKIH